MIWNWKSTKPGLRGVPRGQTRALKCESGINILAWRAALLLPDSTSLRPSAPEAALLKEWGLLSLDSTMKKLAKANPHPAVAAERANHQDAGFGSLLLVAQESLIHGQHRWTQPHSWWSLSVDAASLTVVVIVQVDGGKLRAHMLYAGQPRVHGWRR
jgi:hypothetical protein